MGGADGGGVRGREPGEAEDGVEGNEGAWQPRRSAGRQGGRQRRSSLRRQSLLELSARNNRGPSLAKKGPEARSEGRKRRVRSGGMRKRGKGKV